MKLGYLGQAWLVIVLALGFGGALAGVHVALDERIQSNISNETLSQIPVLVPGSTSAEAETVAGRTVYRAMDGDRQVGWVIRAAGQGFADRIELLIGLDPDMQQLTGLYVLAQKETPGLGNKISEPIWTEQFAGRSANEPLVVTKSDPAGDDQIRAVTGATISSESVCETVNQAVAEVRAAIEADAPTGGE